MIMKQIITDIDNEYSDVLMKLQDDNNEKLLSKDDVLYIHNYAIEEYGGENGVRDKNLLDSVILSPYQEVFGKKLYPTVFDKSAKLLYDFTDYQIFIDGNKRTGVYCCLTLLQINSYKLTLTNDELYRLTMDIANNKITFEDVKKIIKNNSIKLELCQNIEDTINKDNKEHDDYESEQRL